MPKVVIISAVCAAILLLFAVLFFTGNSEPATKTAEPVQDRLASVPATTPRGNDFGDLSSIPAPQAPRKANELASAPPPNSAVKADDEKLAAQEKAFENIENAVITYSPEAVKSIVPMLSSGDPEIRDAAIEGLVQLGEKRGAAALRKAALGARTAEERSRMLEAAEFIELPPMQLEWINPTDPSQANR